MNLKTGPQNKETHSNDRRKYILQYNEIKQKNVSNFRLFVRTIFECQVQEQSCHLLPLKWMANPFKLILFQKNGLLNFGY